MIHESNPNYYLSTPGWRLEERLNREYSPGTAYYDDFAKYIEQGLEEGWVAETGVTSPIHSVQNMVKLTAD